MEKECKKHDKVYEPSSVGNELGSWNNWICKKCGKKGIDFFPTPRDEYNELCNKFYEKEED